MLYTCMIDAICSVRKAICMGTTIDMLADGSTDHATCKRALPCTEPNANSL